MHLLYLLVAFVVFFFMYKKFWDKVENRKKYSAWIDVPQFWAIVLVPLFWPLSLPGYLLWQLLEKLYINLNQENSEKDEESNF